MAERISGPSDELIGADVHVGWGQWADGAKYRLHRGPLDQGYDFEQDAWKARGAFLSWASRRGYTTHTEVIDDNTLVVQAKPKRRDERPSEPRRTRAEIEADPTSRPNEIDTMGRTRATWKAEQEQASAGVG